MAMTQAAVAELSSETLAGQCLAIGFETPEPPRAVLEALADDALAGTVLFRRNIPLLDGAPDLKVLRSLCTQLQGPTSTPALVAVDQEGGRVARLRSHVLQLPPAIELAAKGIEHLKACGEVLGAQLRHLGFTFDFAPVLDVHTNPKNPVIGDRAFATTPERSTPAALAFAEGLRRGGVLSCGKHFPGHGDTLLDSHLALPRLPHDRARLDAIELAPFAAATHLPSWMTAHVLFEAIDPQRPATLSPKIIGELLRGELGYEGCVISDDLEMKAVADHWGVPKAAELAIEAGCDLLLICRDTNLAFQTRDHLAKRADSDTAFRSRLEEAATRVRRLREQLPPAPKATWEELQTRSEELNR